MREIQICFCVKNSTHLRANATRGAVRTTETFPLRSVERNLPSIHPRFVSRRVVWFDFFSLNNAYRFSHFTLASALFSRKPTLRSVSKDRTRPLQREATTSVHFMYWKFKKHLFSASSSKLEGQSLRGTISDGTDGPTKGSVNPGDNQCRYCGTWMTALKLVMHERHCSRLTFWCSLCRPVNLIK